MKKATAPQLLNIRILPAMAIARLGSAATPLDSYTLETDPNAPLGFRKIRRAETLIVDTASGEIIDVLPPSDDAPAFKEDGKIRPVAPFIEVFAEVAKGGHSALQPLTEAMLQQAGLSVRWRVEVGNFKAFRRTNDPGDQIKADSGHFSDHAPQPLHGVAKNFVKKRFIPFGFVQFIRPSEQFPQIRLRFTPGQGLVYGATYLPASAKAQAECPNYAPHSSGIDFPPERIVYDSKKGTWNFKYKDEDETLNTLAQGLYAAYGKEPYFNYYEDPQPARGYLDDACDGIVTVELVDAQGQVQHSARSRICSAPPIFAPDSEFVRTIADDLEQVLNGTTVASATLEQAKDIVRRAYETVRFMNTSVLNLDPVKSRPNRADTMAGNDSTDFNRPLAPIMAQNSMDTLAVVALHQQVYAALQGGAAPWFQNIIRQPEEAADLSDAGRRKMPAMMSGADTRYLALTRRQIDILSKAGRGQLFDQAETEPDSGLTPRNLTAQLHYRGTGNPANVVLHSAVGNCCPGLELDFRSVWKRAFVGITLVEHDNYIILTDAAHQALLHHRLLGFRLPGEAKFRSVVIQATGPTADFSDTVPLSSVDNPDAAMTMEWSNALAAIWAYQGQSIEVAFTQHKAKESQPLLPDDPSQDPHVIVQNMTVRQFFETGTTVIAPELASPGELTQGLCSPWQNDFRECVCYYWASSRPDYVNVEAAVDGGSHGDNWMSKTRNGQYVVDDYSDQRLISYIDLFENWEEVLKFQIGGKDAAEG